MPMIQTVTGPIGPESAGVTLMHEHLQFGIPGWDMDPTVTYDRAGALIKAVEELRAMQRAGGRLLVDVTPITSGRDVDFLVRASRAAEVHVVACTGLWSQIGILGHFQRKSVDELEELFVRELTRGMGTTSVRAGIIKIGTAGEHMVEAEHRLFQAAARAAKRTGAAITTHVSSNLPSPVGVISGREQLKVLLEEEGVDPSRVIIGHCDATHFPDYHLEVVKAGAYAEFDHICDEEGAAYSLPDEVRLPWILALLEKGYERQMLFSMDRIVQRLAGGGGQRFTLASIFTKFLPMLKNAGVGEKTVHTIMVENPRRVLPMPDAVVNAATPARESQEEWQEGDSTGEDA